MTFEEMPDLLTTSQACWALNVSKRQMYILMGSGTVHAVNIQRSGAHRPRYRWSKKDIAALRNRNIGVTGKRIRIQRY